LIPNGSAQLISERIKDALRSRSIVAVYDSIGAKADCTTKNNVSFRIRLYCSREDTDIIVVEIQRREGFHFMYQQDVTAIFDAAEGNAVQPASAVLEFEYNDDEVENYSQSSLNRLSRMLCPTDGEMRTGATEIALPVLISLTSKHETGPTAVLISRDLIYAPDFEQLRDLIFSFACSSNQNALCSNRVKLQSLEVLANSTSCLVGNTDGFGSPINDTIRLHLVSLVETAFANPRAADLACLILKNTTENWRDYENSRLMNALISANSHGREAYADLEVHSQDVMSLITGVVA
jgi:hypothetical protein